MKISPANIADLPKILLLRKICFLQEARLYEKAGYKVTKHDKFHDGVEAVFMEKIIDKR